MPALGPLFIALAALLIILAWQSWTIRILQYFKAQAPGLFGPLFDGIIGADAAVYNALRNWTDPAVQPFSDLINRLTTAARALIENPLAFARHAYGATKRLFEVTIPWVISVAAKNAGILFDEAKAEAESLFKTAQDALASLVADLASLRVRAEQLYNELAERITSALHYALDYALALAHRLENFVVGLVGQEIQRAEQAEQQIVATVEGDIRAVENAAFQEVARVEHQVGVFARGLENELAQARSELGRDIQGFEKLVGDEIDKVLKSGPWGAAIGLYEGGERALKADVETLVVLAAAEIRKQLADVDGLRARYGPTVAEVGSKLVK